MKPGRPAAALRVLVVAPLARDANDIRGGMVRFAEEMRGADFGPAVQLDYLSTYRPVERLLGPGGTGGALCRGLRFFLNAFFAVATMGQLLCRLLRDRPQVVQVHAPLRGAFWLSLGVVFAARLAGARPLLRLGDGRAPDYFGARGWAGRWRRAGLNTCGELIVQSAGWRTAAAPWAPACRIHVLENTVDTAAFAGAGERDWRSFLFVGGRRSHLKGAADVLAVLPAVLAQAAGARFVLVIDDPALLAAAGAWLEAEPRVVVRARLPARELAREMAAGGTLILASRAEGFPNVLLEAMASGMAVIGSRVGAVPDVITAADCGLTFDPGDRDGLQAALLSLATEPRAAARFGARGQQAARARYDRRFLSQNLAAIWRRVVGKRGGRGR